MNVGNNVKPVCLLVFKFRSKWNHHLISKLQYAYDVIDIYANELFQLDGSRGLLKSINQLIQDKSVSLVFFDIDFYMLLDNSIIDGVDDSVKKIAVTFDDLVMHDLNAITADACDMVLSGDPLSVLRYREKNMAAEYLTLEASGDLYCKKTMKKDIEVLHFGGIDKADRREYIEFLQSKGIDICLIGSGSKYIDAELLPEYICRSKLVINFSKTDFFTTSSFDVAGVQDYYLQFKGRVIEAGLCGTACVSEVSPAMSLLFAEEEVPTFSTKEGCYEIILKLLADDRLRESYASRLHGKTLEKYEDSVLMDGIKCAIDNVQKRRRSAIRTAQLSYRRMALRARMHCLMLKPVLALKEMARVMMSEKVFPLYRVLLLADMAASYLFFVSRFYARKLRAAN